VLSLDQFNGIFGGNSWRRFALGLQRHRLVRAT